MRNIHEINAALFESKYEVIPEHNNYFTIYDRSLSQGFQVLALLKGIEDVLWFIVDNCTLSRKPN